MAGLFKHVLFLFVLAAVCYVVAIVVADNRLGFIAFFVIGLVAELAFWILFWRERRSYRRSGVGGHA